MAYVPPLPKGRPHVPGFDYVRYFASTPQPVDVGKALAERRFYRDYAHARAVRLVKHLPALHNQKSHGNQYAKTPWLFDAIVPNLGPAFPDPHKWMSHVTSYAKDPKYRTDFNSWYEKKAGKPYLPWSPLDEKLPPPVPHTKKPGSKAPKPPPEIPTPMPAGPDLMDQTEWKAALADGGRYGTVDMWSDQGHVTITGLFSYDYDTDRVEVTDAVVDQAGSAPKEGVAVHVVFDKRGEPVKTTVVNDPTDEFSSYVEYTKPQLTGWAEMEPAAFLGAPNQPASPPEPVPAPTDEVTNVGNIQHALTALGTNTPGFSFSALGVPWRFTPTAESAMHDHSNTAGTGEILFGHYMLSGPDLPEGLDGITGTLAVKVDYSGTWTGATFHNEEGDPVATFTPMYQALTMTEPTEQPGAKPPMVALDPGWVSDQPTSFLSLTWHNPDGTLDKFPSTYKVEGKPTITSDSDGGVTLRYQFADGSSSVEVHLNPDGTLKSVNTKSDDGTVNDLSIGKVQFGAVADKPAVTVFAPGSKPSKEFQTLAALGVGGGKGGVVTLDGVQSFLVQQPTMETLSDGSWVLHYEPAPGSNVRVSLSVAKDGHVITFQAVNDLDHKNVAYKSDLSGGPAPVVTFHAVDMQHVTTEKPAEIKVTDFSLTTTPPVGQVQKVTFKGATPGNDHNSYTMLLDPGTMKLDTDSDGNTTAEFAPTSWGVYDNGEAVLGHPGSSSISIKPDKVTFIFNPDGTLKEMATDTNVTGWKVPEYFDATMSWVPDPNETPKGGSDSTPLYDAMKNKTIPPKMTFHWDGGGGQPMEYPFTPTGPVAVSFSADLKNPTLHIPVEYEPQSGVNVGKKIPGTLTFDTTSDGKEWLQAKFVTPDPDQPNFAFGPAHHPITYGPVPAPAYPPPIVPAGKQDWNKILGGGENIGKPVPSITLHGHGGSVTYTPTEGSYTSQSGTSLAGSTSYSYWNMQAPDGTTGLLDVWVDSKTGEVQNVVFAPPGDDPAEHVLSDGWDLSVGDTPPAPVGPTTTWTAPDYNEHPPGQAFPLDGWGLAKDLQPGHKYKIERGSQWFEGYYVGFGKTSYGDHPTVGFKVTNPGSWYQNADNPTGFHVANVWPPNANMGDMTATPLSDKDWSDIINEPPTYHSFTKSQSVQSKKMALGVFQGYEVKVTTFDGTVHTGMAESVKGVKPTLLHLTKRPGEKDYAYGIGVDVHVSKIKSIETTDTKFYQAHQAYLAGESSLPAHYWVNDEAIKTAPKETQPYVLPKSAAVTTTMPPKPKPTVSHVTPVTTTVPTTVPSPSPAAPPPEPVPYTPAEGLSGLAPMTAETPTVAVGDAELPPGFAGENPVEAPPTTALARPPAPVSLPPVLPDVSSDEAWGLGHPKGTLTLTPKDGSMVVAYQVGEPTVSPVMSAAGGTLYQYPVSGQDPSYSVAVKVDKHGYPMEVVEPDGTRWTKGLLNGPMEVGDATIQYEPADAPAPAPVPAYAPPPTFQPVSGAEAKALVEDAHDKKYEVAVSDEHAGKWFGYITATDNDGFTLAWGSDSAPGGTDEYVIQWEKLTSAETTGGESIYPPKGWAAKGAPDVYTEFAGGAPAAPVDAPLPTVTPKASPALAVTPTDHDPYADPAVPIVLPSGAVDRFDSSWSAQPYKQKAGGSNPGGFFTDHDGHKWYIKVGMQKSSYDTQDPYRYDDRSKNEVIAASLYREAGIDVPRVELIDLRERKGDLSSGALDSPAHLGVKSDIVGQDGEHTIESLGSRMGDPDALAEAQKGFAVDAWLANWDVAGTGADNIIFVDGKPVRIDVGGSMLYRAQGGLKGEDFTYDVKELDTMRGKSGHATDTTKVFSSMTDQEVRDSFATTVAQITEDQIDQTISGLALSDGQAQTLADKLKKRRLDMAEKLGVNLPDHPEVDYKFHYENKAIAGYGFNDLDSYNAAVDWWGGKPGLDEVNAAMGLDVTGFANVGQASGFARLTGIHDPAEFVRVAKAAHHVRAANGYTDQDIVARNAVLGWDWSEFADVVDEAEHGDLHDQWAAVDWVPPSLWEQSDDPKWKADPPHAYDPWAFDWFKKKRQSDPDFAAGWESWAKDMTALHKAGITSHVSNNFDPGQFPEAPDDPNAPSREVVERNNWFRAHLAHSKWAFQNPPSHKPTPGEVAKYATKQWGLGTIDSAFVEDLGSAWAGSANSSQKLFALQWAALERYGFDLGSIKQVDVGDSSEKGVYFEITHDDGRRLLLWVTKGQWNYLSDYLSSPSQRDKYKAVLAGWNAAAAKTWASQGVDKVAVVRGMRKTKKWCDASGIHVYHSAELEKNGGDVVWHPVDSQQTPIEQTVAQRGIAPFSVYPNMAAKGGVEGGSDIVIVYRAVMDVSQVLGAHGTSNGHAFLQMGSGEGEVVAPVGFGYEVAAFEGVSMDVIERLLGEGVHWDG